MNTPQYNVQGQLIEFSEDDVRPDGTLVIDVVRDIYRPTQNWLARSENMVIPDIVTAEGGQVLAGGIRLPVTVIISSWRIRPPNNCTNIELRGNIITEDGTSAFVQTESGHDVSVYEATKRLKGGLTKWNIISLILLAIAEVIVCAWIINDPKEYEPYTAFCLVLVTFIQIASQSRHKEA
ncbi:hypothetical protein EHS89_16065 [Amphritea balenae]|uniref:Uncharacterized protein n=1 Tax=Amphritea balenae TaxID=452629 RepID=A0A3P1SLV6_9GAMM|nr:hypothetical protein [Amphritea balenae]RRC97695.1 hypothetical protein EHS89_16065 [Amphritea balenae]